MKNNSKRIITVILLWAGVTVIALSQSGENDNLNRAKQLLDAVHTHYSAEGTPLLRENYPFEANYSGAYIAAADTGSKKQFAYLWPFSGIFSGVNALLKTTNDKKYLEILKTQTLPGLQKYYSVSLQPPCYASYLNEARWSDRFYDDNIWLGIDFMELYTYSGEQLYLDKAKEIWTFILSGIDDELGGGIYWCEQRKRSKNTCSNAPGSVLAFKIFEATKDSAFFHQGLELYNWTKKNLQDPEDKLYWDNINLNGQIGKAKYPYNSGQMLQSAVLLYKLTKDRKYLQEAQDIAEVSINYFTKDFTTGNGKTFRLIKPGNVWFVAVMMRGFMELYHQDHNKKYLETFNLNLDYAWKNARDENGLFSDNWDGSSVRPLKALLNQAAFVEMYASVASVEF